MIELQIRKLYKKLRSKIFATLKSDEFYNEFLDVVRSGKREYTQHNTELYKTIDETWVSAIEECIPYLEDIVNKPRRTLKSEGVVMPVELAKKINSESVRHLASHTQYIRKVDSKGYVVPNKILTAINDDTIDIYENRFVMTLLKRLNTFIDKRYAIIGKKVGNEVASKLNIATDFEQNGEDTSYEMSMMIHQGVDYLNGNESDDMSIYRRLEQVRKYINSFKNSEFYRTLKDKPSVRVPIMKTNMIVGSAEYSACYRLWKFLDSYKEAGYTLESKEVDMTISEEVLLELDSMTMFSYLILKNNMLGIIEDARAAQFKKAKVTKPKFTKKYQALIKDTENIDTVQYMPFAQDNIKEIIDKALSNEQSKQERERQEKAKSESEIAKILQQAIKASEPKRDYVSEERKLADEKKIYDILDRAINNELEKQRIEQEKLDELIRAKELAKKASEETVVKPKEIPVEELQEVVSTDIQPQEEPETEPKKHKFGGIKGLFKREGKRK